MTDTLSDKKEGGIPLTIKNLVTSALFRPLQIANENIGQDNVNRIQSLSEEERLYLQLSSLSQLLMLFLKDTDPSWIKNSLFIEAIVAKIALYLNEKTTDDAGRMNTSGTDFEFGDDVSFFSDMTVEAITGSPIPAGVFNNIPDLPVESLQMTQKILSKLLCKEVATADVFYWNLLATKNVADIIKEISSLHPELHSLSQFALENLANRYSSVMSLIDNPGIKLEGAMILGEQSILTNVTFSIFFLMLCTLDTLQEFKKTLVANVDSVIKAIRASTLLIRLFNDCGPLLFHQNKVIDKLLSINPEMNIREFFQENMSSFSTEEKNIFARVLKDITLREYSIPLNAGAPLEGMTQKIFMKNLVILSQEAMQSLSSLRILLRQLPDELDEIKLILSRFVVFNYSMYSRYQGDYTTSAEEDLRKVIKTDNWESVLNLILSQSDMEKTHFNHLYNDSSNEDTEKAVYSNLFHYKGLPLYPTLVEYLLNEEKRHVSLPDTMSHTIEGELLRFAKVGTLPIEVPSIEFATEWKIYVLKDESNNEVPLYLCLDDSRMGGIALIDDRGTKRLMVHKGGSLQHSLLTVSLQQKIATEGLPGREHKTLILGIDLKGFSMYGAPSRDLFPKAGELFGAAGLDKVILFNSGGKLMKWIVQALKTLGKMFRVPNLEKISSFETPFQAINFILESI